MPTEIVLKIERGILKYYPKQNQTIIYNMKKKLTPTSVYDVIQIIYIRRVSS